MTCEDQQKFVDNCVPYTSQSKSILTDEGCSCIVLYRVRKQTNSLFPMTNTISIVLLCINLIIGRQPLAHALNPPNPLYKGGSHLACPVPLVKLACPIPPCKGG